MIAIVGDSGSGKSTSIKNPMPDMIGLDPTETFVLNVMGKPLPFKGSKSLYDVTKKPSEGGNYFSTTNYQDIFGILDMINVSRNDVKNVIVDDAQYLFSDEFMAKAMKTGYQKFTEMALHFYTLLQKAKSMRDDINFIVLTHSDYDDKQMSYKVKTIGKMLDEKVNIAGLFTTLLYSVVEQVGQEVKYSFVTNRYVDNLGNTWPAKSPAGMFEDQKIPNDLGYVVKQVTEYYA